MGIHYTTPSNAQLFIQTGPILLAIAGFVFFKEKLNRNQVIGFTLAVLGLSFFYRDQLSAFFDSQGQYKIGVIFTLTSALAWATYAISQKKLVSKYSVDSLNLFLFGFPAVLYLPFVNFAPLADLGFYWWLLLLFLGANTYIAYTCLALALKYTEANKVSVIIILNPIITFITMGILTELNVDWVAHERFSMITILGASLVLTGAFFVSKKSKR
jgi:drug/metabolite transporter (DMT)-like permease